MRPVRDGYRRDVPPGGKERTCTSVSERCSSSSSWSSSSPSRYDSPGCAKARQGGPSSFHGWFREALQARDVDRLRAFVALLLLVGDTRPLRQRAIPVRVDAAVMDEQVAVALVGGDEAEPLVVAEPLDGPGGHAEPVLRCSTARRPRPALTARNLPSRRAPAGDEAATMPA